MDRQFADLYPCDSALFLLLNGGIFCLRYIITDAGKFSLHKYLAGLKANLPAKHFDNHEFVEHWKNIMNHKLQYLICVIFLYALIGCTPIVPNQISATLPPVSTKLPAASPTIIMTAPIKPTLNVTFTPNKNTDQIPTITTSSQTISGINITIQKILSTSDQFEIDYKITGLPVNIWGPERTQTMIAFSEKHKDDPIPEKIILPNGKVIDHEIGGGCQGGGDINQSWISCQIIYPPLPTDTQTLNFKILRIHNALPGELPEDWLFSVKIN